MTGIEVAVVFCLLVSIGFSWHVLVDMGHIEVPELAIGEALEALEELV